MKYFKVITFFGLLGWAVSASATIREGLITSVLVNQANTNKVFFKVDAEPVVSGCQTGLEWNYVFDTSTETGKCSGQVNLATV